MKYGSHQTEHLKKDNNTQDDWYSYNSIAIQHLCPYIPTLSEVYMNLDDDFLFLRNVPISAIYNQESQKATWDVWLWRPKLVQNHYLKGLKDNNQYLSILHNATAEYQQFEQNVILSWWQHSYDVAQKLAPHRMCVQDRKGQCFVPQHGPMLLFKSLIMTLWEDNEQDFTHTVHYHKFRLAVDPELRFVSSVIGTPTHYTCSMKTTVYFDQLSPIKYLETLSKLKRIKESAHTARLESFLTACLNDSMD
eukprot:Awhi_evm2s1246